MDFMKHFGSPSADRKDTATVYLNPNFFKKEVHISADEGFTPSRDGGATKSYRYSTHAFYDGQFFHTDGNIPFISTIPGESARMVFFIALATNEAYEKNAL